MPLKIINDALGKKESDLFTKITITTIFMEMLAGIVTNRNPFGMWWSEQTMRRQKTRYNVPSHFISDRIIIITVDDTKNNIGLGRVEFR